MNDIWLACSKCGAEHSYGGWVPQEGRFRLNCDCGETLRVIDNWRPLSHIGPFLVEGEDGIWDAVPQVQ